MATYISPSQINLALMQTYGSNAWRIHNYLLEAVAKQSEKALEELKQLTVEVNRERKNLHVQCLSLSLRTRS
jgi:pre-mRNA-splicing factor SPF27